MKRVVCGVIALVAMASSAVGDGAYRGGLKDTLAPLNWTGFYIGGHAGWAAVEEVRSVVTDPTGGFPAGFRFCCDRDGFIGGAQAGFNWQVQKWVFGIEGDWSWTNSEAHKHPASTLVPGLVMNAFATDNWYATLTGRIGYAHGNWLIYGKGGAAWLNSDRGAVINGVPVAGTVTVATRTDTFTGWTLGAGIEWALGMHWSAKVEYNYMDLGTNRLDFTAVAPAAAAGTISTQGFDTEVHAVKIGLNYRF